MTDSTDNARGPELKPCPFCGSRGIDRDTYWHRDYCTNCGGKGPAAGNSVKAVWNTRADLAPNPLGDPRVGLTQAATIAETIMQKHAKAHYSGEAVRVFKSGDDTLSESAAKAYCAGEILEAIRAALAALSPTGGNDE